MIQHRPLPDLHHVIDLSGIPKCDKLEHHVSIVKIALVFHIYHTYAIIEIYQRLQSITFSFDLYIVIPHNSPSSQVNISDLFAEFNPIIISCSNHGRDIGGKLHALRYIHSQHIEYQYIILAHDKISDSHWRKNLYDEIFRNDLAMSSINGFLACPAIKLTGGHIREGHVNCLYQKEDYLSYTTFLGKNYQYVEHLLKILDTPMPRSGAYVAGTMFWIEWMYFKSILTIDRLSKIIGLLESEFKEPSYAHAMERVFGILATNRHCKLGRVASGYGYPDIATHYQPKNQ